MRSLAITLTASITLASAAPLLAQRSGCGPTRRPKELPAVSAVMDSGSAIMELSVANVLRDSMQFTLLMLPGDSIPVIHAIDSTDDVAAAVLERSAWPETPADLWAVRVHVTGGNTPALAITRATYCPPVLTPEAGPPVRMLPELREQRIISPDPNLPRVMGTRPVPAIFEIEITPRGVVSNVTLIRSSGSHVFDELTKRQLAQQAYEPALLDGIPIPIALRTDKSTPGP